MKRVLVVCYSQTGQLRACTEAFVAALREDPEIQVDLVEPRAEADYPFPMGFKAFLGVFPESVLGEPPALRPLPLEPGARYDLVVLAYQVWYLSPALPALAFLKSPAAEALRDTPVVALCACRNMWQRGWVELKKLVEQRGGRIIDHLVLVDQGPAWATFYTTPRWLLWGQKEGGPFPPAGVSAEAIEGLRPLGELLREAVRAGRLSSSVFRAAGREVVKVEKRFLIPELGAKAFFRVWARGIRAIARVLPGLRYPLGIAWFGWLLSVLPLLPVCALIGAGARVLFPGWYRARIEELAGPSGGGSE